jgi:FixJ family two-component response regulator
MNAAAFFRKPVDGSALLDAIDWAVRWNLANGSADENENDESSEKRLKILFDSHRGRKP